MAIYIPLAQYSLSNWLPSWLYGNIPIPILFYSVILMRTYILVAFPNALMLSEQCLQCTGIHIPPTFRDGTIPIDAIFVTAGIECINVYTLLHKGGVGNHRCFIVDFTSSSIIRTKFPNIVWCSARKLHCKLTRLVQSYNAKLDMLCNQHKMFQRIYFIYSHIDCFSDDNFFIWWKIGTVSLSSSSSTWRLHAQNSKCVT